MTYLILFLCFAMIIRANRDAAIVRAESERFPPARPISHVRKVRRDA